MKLDQKQTRKIIIIAVAALVVIAALVFLLRNVGAGKKPERPITLLSTMEFNQWLGSGGSALTGKETAGTYYFKLAADVKLSKSAVIDNGHTVVIDLNGHTVTGANGKQLQAFLVSEGASLTLKGGAVEMAGADTNGGLIAVDGAGCGLNLENVVLTNTDDTLIGQNLGGGVLLVKSPVEAADNPAVVTISGTTVINGSTSGLRRNGGTICAEGAAQIRMYGGTIQNGVAACSGNVHLADQAKFHMHDGLISGGVAKGKSEMTGLGGNVNVRGKAGFYLYGGSVAGGQAENNGGNIFISNFGADNEEHSLHIYGGKVESGVAKNYGGNIYATDKESVIRVYGGSVEKGVALSGGNFYLESAGLELRGGVLAGQLQSEEIAYGGNVAAFRSQIDVYDGCYVLNGISKSCGGNFYLNNTVMNIYGGTIMSGGTLDYEVNQGGGNLYAAGESIVNLYGGEISGGVSNQNHTPETSAAGGNVMIAEKTQMHMYGGTIKEGMVYGKICRGGSVYVYGQAKGNNAVFHMYSGKIQNGLLNGTMRGMCVAAYSNSNGEAGYGIARLFGGTIQYTGAASNPNRVYSLYSNRGHLYIYESGAYSGIAKSVTRGACPDETHFTEVEKLEATCITPGCTKYTCNTCGDWYEVAGSATGHWDLGGEPVELDGQSGFVKFTCECCGIWYRSEKELEEQKNLAKVEDTVPEPLVYPNYTYTEAPTTQQLRQTAVQAARDLLSVQWCSPEGFGYYKEGSKKFFEYPQKMTFGGVMYSGASAGLFHFLEFYDSATGRFTYPGTADELKMEVGSACTDSLLWSWATVCNSFTGAYHPNELVVKNGFIPVGEYTYNQAIESFAMLSTEDIAKDNGEQTMAKSYAKMLPADILVSSTDIHSMMVIEEPFVLSAPDGSIDLKASYVMIQDQRGGVGSGFYEVEHEDYTVYHSGRISQKFTFAELLEKNYLPVTAAEFLGQDAYEAPQVTVDGEATTLEEMQQLTVTANYPIAVININVLSRDGSMETLERIFFNGLSEDGVPRSYALAGAEALKNVDSTVYGRVIVEVVTSTGQRVNVLQCDI